MLTLLQTCALAFDYLLRRFESVLVLAPAHVLVRVLLRLLLCLRCACVALRIALRLRCLVLHCVALCCIALRLRCLVDGGIYALE